MTRTWRTCALDGCERDITACRLNKRYCKDAHRLAAFRQRRADGANPLAAAPSERFPPSARMVAPQSVIEDLGTFLDELPSYAGDHHDPEAVFEALLDLQLRLEEVLDTYPPDGGGS